MLSVADESVDTCRAKATNNKFSIYYTLWKLIHDILNSQGSAHAHSTCTLIRDDGNSSDTTLCSESVTILCDFD